MYQKIVIIYPVQKRDIVNNLLSYMGIYEYL